MRPDRHPLEIERPKPVQHEPGQRKSGSKTQKRLCRLVGQAIADYAMIEDGDRVMVCLSGGKDSYGLLDVLVLLRRRAPIRFELVAVTLDQRQPGFPANVLADYLNGTGVSYHIETEDTYSVVTRLIPEGETYCSLCSRLRRGILYRVASEIGATKIALGHHRDDIVETLLLNMMFAGRLKAMPPKLLANSRRHVVIRPLAYVREADLARYAEERKFPIIPCDLCGSQEDLKRNQVKALLKEWEQRFPGCGDNMFAALTRVVPSHLLDRGLFDFTALHASDTPMDGGSVEGDFELWEDLATSTTPIRSPSTPLSPSRGRGLR